jgi:hypothetical protein
VEFILDIVGIEESIKVVKVVDAKVPISVGIVGIVDVIAPIVDCKVSISVGIVGIVDAIVTFVVSIVPISVGIVGNVDIIVPFVNTIVPLLVVDLTFSIVDVKAPVLFAELAFVVENVVTFVDCSSFIVDLILFIIVSACPVEISSLFVVGISSYIVPIWVF